MRSSGSPLPVHLVTLEGLGRIEIELPEGINPDDSRGRSLLEDLDRKPYPWDLGREGLFP